jgi:hypothetical protein
MTVYIKAEDGDWSPIGQLISFEPDPSEPRDQVTYKIDTKPRTVEFTLLDWNPEMINIIYGFDYLVLSRTVKEWLTRVHPLPLSLQHQPVRRTLPGLSAVVGHPDS